ncbi:(2Fe-2S)-binding protein [Burkholderia sp. FERM BP-3421]|jgi:aerobic-type carbon monoxide dehydrogenase small subunit (CoxS/CutS family)|uniref:(2Fe-2S)-binding protein n=1 Tax=Burkholderia sp. FERM BP-3421 TaxID=1494466 RepID=UPI0023609360|nr:(2Fe-2S)-binding protein [Burkholderia sp. FERM BP-3421]WDD92017.1 (2Fe-2S)-binding protein [Burkholderia sp. FERM BP-3421]
MTAAQPAASATQGAAGAPTASQVQNASAASAAAAAPASGASAAAPVERPLVQYRPQPLSMTVNGQSVGPMPVPAGIMMIDFLHEYLGLTGSRLGCGQGICHACVVIVDQPDGSSEEVRTCITGAHFFDGRRVRTVEGHAKRNDAGDVVELSPIQQKFLEHFSFQCGYCTPGFVNAATVLLERLKLAPIARADVESVITEALNPHLCRCTGYVRYYEAVKDLVLGTPGLVKDAA